MNEREIDGMLDNSNEEELIEALEEIKVSNGKKIDITNKRIDFNKKSLKRLETMLPIYKEEIGEKVSTSELYSYVIGKSIDSLFEGDFKNKLEKL